MSGVFAKGPADRGEIRVFGNQLQRDAGIGVIHLSSVDQLCVCNKYHQTLSGIN
jgi:hypothetical protein